MKKILKISGILLGIGIVLIFIVLIVIISLSLFFHGKKDIDNYGKFEDYLGYSKLAIFPKEVSDDNIQSYFYLNRDMPLDPICEIYLKCTYSAEEYNSEVERLKNIQNIKYDEENFNYKAYVSMYNFSSCYEYALLLEEEKTIVYINTQGIYGNWLQGLRFDKEYLPKDFMKDIEYTGDGEKNFTIY